MAEYVNEDKPMIIVNETDSDFNVGVGMKYLIEVILVALACPIVLPLVIDEEDEP